MRSIAGDIKNRAGTAVYKNVAWPIISLMNPELSHNFSVWLAKTGLTPVDRVADDAVLQTTFLGKTFSENIDSMFCLWKATSMREGERRQKHVWVGDPVVGPLCAENPLGLAAGCDKHGEAVSLQLIHQLLLSFRSSLPVE